MLFRSNETAYEIPTSDWSSDVCSSDLIEGDRFEHYLPDMKPIVEMKTTDIDGFFAGTIAFAAEQAKG